MLRQASRAVLRGRHASCLGAVARRETASTTAAPHFHPRHTWSEPRKYSATGGLLLSGAAAAATYAVLAPQHALAEATPAPATPSKNDIAGVRAALNAALDEEEELAVSFVALAWAACATYDAGSGLGGSDSGGGSDGLTPRGSEDALDGARVALRRVAGLFPGVSAADVVTLAGATGIEHMGGPLVRWRGGRTRGGAGGVGGGDMVTCSGVAAPREAVSAVRKYWARLGVDDREAVALMGGYAVCRGYPERPEGVYGDEAVGAWAVRPPTFSNEYFRDLVEGGWVLREGEGFCNRGGGAVMHAADLALIWDEGFRKVAEEFAGDEDAWFHAFADAFQKIQESGVAELAGKPRGKPWYQFW